MNAFRLSMSSSWDANASMADRIARPAMAPKAKHDMVLKEGMMGLAEHGLCSPGQCRA